MGLIPGLGRSPGGGSGNPLQHSCLENSMDREAWRATIHGVAESDTTEATKRARQLDKLKIPNTYFINSKTGMASSPHSLTPLPPPPLNISEGCAEITSHQVHC